MYRKEDIKVLMDDGSTVTGMIYLMNQGVPTKPSYYYYNVIASGYDSFGFDKKILQAAVDTL